MRNFKYFTTIFCPELKKEKKINFLGFGEFEIEISLSKCDLSMSHYAEKAVCIFMDKNLKRKKEIFSKTKLVFIKKKYLVLKLGKKLQ